jgi:hypothetical protein
MRKTAFCLALLGLLALSGQAVATICSIDEVPAATLLLPYFQLDLANPNGLTTLFSINNASATAILAHVVVWSDLSVPVLDFNVYLTGYDVQSINLRDIIVSGILPRTASAGQDPTDTISNKGQFSQDINFASCSGALPPPALPSSFISHLQNSLTGSFSSILGGCAGRAFGDNVARGYVTVDTVVCHPTKLKCEGGERNGLGLAPFHSFSSLLSSWWGRFFLSSLRLISFPFSLSIYCGGNGIETFS